jgi:hypothetical protein
MLIDISSLLPRFGGWNDLRLTTYMGQNSGNELLNRFCLKRRKQMAGNQQNGGDLSKWSVSLLKSRNSQNQRMRLAKNDVNVSFVRHPIKYSMDFINISLPRGSGMRIFSIRWEQRWRV